MSTRKPWTDEEIGFLQDHADWTAARVADGLGRTLRSVHSARYLLRKGELGRGIKPRWTADEDATLLDAGPRMTAESLAELLPGRSADSIAYRRAILGIRSRGELPTSVAGRPLLAKTCIDCGRLLAGSWFHFRKSMGYASWSPRCRSCHSEQGSEWTSRRREGDEVRAREKERAEQRERITADRATRSGEPYTDQDYEVLADVNLSDFQKALRLGRTQRAVVAARRRAGLRRSREGLGDPERDLWIIDNPNESLAPHGLQESA